MVIQPRDGIAAERVEEPALNEADHERVLVSTAFDERVAHAEFRAKLCLKSTIRENAARDNHHASDCANSRLD
jgi:hypothetical protein